MSWPTDGEPRYVVVTTRGYTIMNPPGQRRGSSREQATYAVLDRAYCYAEVESWRTETYDRGRSKLSAETRAEARCAELNAEHEADLLALQK